MLFKNFNSVIYNIKNGNKKSSFKNNILIIKIQLDFSPLSGKNKPQIGLIDKNKYHGDENHIDYAGTDNFVIIGWIPKKAEDQLRKDMINSQKLVVMLGILQM